MLVELSKRDLLNYSMKDLRLIAKHRRLKQTGTKASLAERIAVSLMSHKAEMTSEIEFKAEKARLLSRRFDYGFSHGIVLRADGSIFCWGTNDMGECDAPAGNDYIAVAAGDRYSFAVKSDGSIVKWGNTSRLPVNNTGFVDVATGTLTNMGLKGDGSVVLWDINPEIPQQIIRGDFIHIVSRGDVFAALSRGGSVFVWQMGLDSQVLQGNYIDMTIDTENDKIDTLSSTGNVIKTYKWDTNFLIDNNNVREERYNNEEFIAISGKLALKMDGGLINVYNSDPLPDNISNHRYIAISKGPYVYLLADTNGIIYEYNYAVGTFRQITDNNSPVLISTSVESGGQPDIQALPPQPYERTVAEEIITDYLKVLTTEELQRETMDSIIDFLPYNLTAAEKDEIKTFIKNKYKEILQTAIDENNVEKINAIERWARVNESGQMIIMVMRYRQSQRAPATADDDEEDEETPEEAKVCNNPTDMISQEKWSSDYLPDVKLTLLDERERTVCYDRENLLKWLNNSDNYRLLWAPDQVEYSINASTFLDDNGYVLAYSAPGLTESQRYAYMFMAGPLNSLRLLQLPDRTNITTNVDLLTTATELKGIPIAKNIRIGNIEGSYGQSRTHGQIPGETIYLVVNKNEDDLAVLKEHLKNLVNRRRRYTQGLLRDFNILAEIIDSFVANITKERLLTIIDGIYKKYPAEDSDYSNTGYRVNPGISRQLAPLGQQPAEPYEYAASPEADQPAPQQPLPDAEPDVASILNFEQAESDDELEVYNSQYGSFINRPSSPTAEGNLRVAFENGDVQSINEIIDEEGDFIDKLDLSDLELSDISPLRGLVNLRELNLSGNPIVDISPLADLELITILNLSDSNVNDISPLRNHPYLTALNLSATYVTDLGPLRGLLNLDTLKMMNTLVTDLSPLTGLNIGTLNLSRSGHITNIEPLATLANLQELDLSNTRVTDLTLLEGLSHLQKLTVDEGVVIPQALENRLSEIHRI